MDWPNHPRLRLAAKQVRAGEVIAYPTEGVWGLGCDPGNSRAVAKLLVLKDRPVGKGLILIAADMAQLEPYIGEISEAQRRQLAETWPGPITWVVPCSSAVPRWIRGDFTTVAVRVSAHPIASALCQAFGGALVSTSANPTGRPPARDPLTVRRYFPRQLASITPGTVGGAQKPSQIRDLSTGAVLRS